MPRKAGPLHDGTNHGVDGPSKAQSQPSADDVRAQLERLVASPDFDAPARARKFLRYIVEETLAGRADRIKAYSVGTEVFERDANFDAQSDPVVRIEAGRLRRALEHYYLVPGLSDPVIIDIPKGAYIPHFTLRAIPEVEAVNSPIPATALPIPPAARHLLAEPAPLRPEDEPSGDGGVPRGPESAGGRAGRTPFARLRAGQDRQGHQKTCDDLPKVLHQSLTKKNDPPARSVCFDPGAA